MNSECDREDTAFMFVAEVAREVSPSLIRSRTS